MKAFEKNIRKVEPYVPGEQPQGREYIKLNTNENPYPPAPGVQQALRDFDTSRLALYPDANGKALKTALANRFGLKSSQVFLGNGSDDVLALAFQSFFCSDEPVLYPDITYSFYPVWCDLFRIPYATVPLSEDFCVNIRDYGKPNGGVVLPNPNAPTGRGVSLAFLEDLLQHNADCVVIIDEAYVDFGAESCVPMIYRYDNLLVTQTVSRRKEFAVYQSLGMTLGQLRRLVLLEGAVSAAGMAAVLIPATLTFALWVMPGVIAETSWVAVYTFDVLPLWVILPVEAVLALATPFLCLGFVTKGTIQERLGTVE